MYFAIASVLTGDSAVTQNWRRPLGQNWIGENEDV